MDNNSSDGTSEVAAEIWQKLGSAIPLRIVEETKPGTARARKKGILEAHGEYILFCDDDNYLSSNYIDEAITTIRLDPLIAVVAGNGKPALQSAPPDWLRHCYGFLACAPQSVKKGNAGIIGFYTAGMILRRSAVLQVYDNFELRLSGRIGKENLAAGEDLELCLLLTILGYQIWGNPELTFKHAIAIERIDWNYMKSLRYANGKANARLAPINFVARRCETAFKSQWFVQCLATLVRACCYGTGYLFSKQTALKFWFQLGRLRELWSCRRSYPESVERLVKVRDRFAKVK